MTSGSCWITYISIHGPVVVFELADVMLRGTLHLIDFQQQLVLLWLIGTWSRRMKLSTLGNVQSHAKQCLACSWSGGGGKTERHTLVRKVVNRFSGKPAKGDTLSFWITALYSLHHATDTSRCKEWRLPSGAMSALGVQGLDGENNVVQCDRSLQKENENPSQGGLGPQTIDCHTSKHKQVSVKAGVLCSAVKPQAFYAFFCLLLFSLNSAALPCQPHNIDLRSHE